MPIPVKVPLRQKHSIREEFDYNLAECVMSPEHLSFSIEFETKEEAGIAISEAKKFLEALGLEMKEC